MSIEYFHKDIKGERIELPANKVICVGRNYLEHIHELNNEVPSESLLFLKPSTALVELSQPVNIPTGLGPCHNELEVAILIGKRITSKEISNVESAIWGVGLGLDLTLRNVQKKLKEKGHPWERAKAFDGSCPMSMFIPKSKVENMLDLSFSLTVNNELRQRGNTKDMLVPILSLLIEISQSFTLLPGDIVMTGTPKGVDALMDGDSLRVEFDGYFSIDTQVSNR